MATFSAPILSTPAEHILDDPSQSDYLPKRPGLGDEQLYVQYEIKKTINDIRNGKWKRIALQFPDDMLVDAPKVYEYLRDGLKSARQDIRSSSNPSSFEDAALHHVDGSLAAIDLNATNIPTDQDDATDEVLCILGDTSYGACCVDEVAAEHVNADVVVHYGRACLSPTKRLPVIYVFTTRPMNLESAIESFKTTYPDKDEKVCLMADIPYTRHIANLHKGLAELGYTDIFATEILRDPSSPLPNRSVPLQVKDGQEKLANYSVFHIASPPASLLLVLSARVKAIHVLEIDAESGAAMTAALTASTARTLRRRYALVTRVSTVPIFGILINTLSVSNYMEALQYCQGLISRAGKKSYVFVVGKVNAAKVANFSEIGGWVVIGCWESSLIENRDFYRPIITPFELEVALTADDRRTWGSEWISDFSALLGRKGPHDAEEARENGSDEQGSDDEPPEFDLRTGKYVSHSRPMHRVQRESSSQISPESKGIARTPAVQALTVRAKGDLATVGGQFSPAAEFLRAQRTWQGLGSDHEIAYERDEQGKIIGAPMEEGRSGVAKGYTVGPAEQKS